MFAEAILLSLGDDWTLRHKHQRNGERVRCASGEWVCCGELPPLPAPRARVRSGTHAFSLETRVGGGRNVSCGQSRGASAQFCLGRDSGRRTGEHEKPGRACRVGDDPREVGDGRKEIDKERQHWFGRNNQVVSLSRTSGQNLFKNLY